jgi:hypothetical protein
LLIKGKDEEYDFLCDWYIIDGNNKLSKDIAYDLDFFGEYSDSFTALKSTTIYLIVTDADFMKGGSYKLTVNFASHINGTVKDKKGKPIKNVLVLVYSSRTMSLGSVLTNYSGGITDGKGKYSLTINPGSYKLWYINMPKNEDDPPRYLAQYYKNKYSLRKATAITAGAAKSLTLADIKLAPYKAPATNKKVKSLPFKNTSKLNTKSPEIQLATSGVPYYGKVYSVSLKKGCAYEFNLSSNSFISSCMDIYDSKGNLVDISYQLLNGSKHLFPFTPEKSGRYKVAVYDMFSIQYSKKYSFRISKAFRPSNISGNVHDGIDNVPVKKVFVCAIKKYGG